MGTKASMLKASRLRELLHYDPETGVFTWIVPPCNSIHAGDAAGSPNGKGYLVIGVDRVRVGSHRLAWLYMTGEWPNGQIDHIDLNRSNNRWANLRDATQSQNLANTLARANSKSGFKGVYWHKRRAKWHAQIRHRGKGKSLGLFDSAGDAHRAYYAAAKELHGEFARSA